MIRHGTLSANVVSTVTLSSTNTPVARPTVYNPLATTSYDRKIESVRVTNRSVSDAVFFTVDGSAPTVAGNDTYVVLGQQSVEIPVAPSTSVSVKLVSTAAAPYSVGY